MRRERCASSDGYSGQSVEPLSCQKYRAESRADGGDSDSDEVIVSLVFAEPLEIEECVQLRVTESDARLFLGRRRSRGVPHRQVVHGFGDTVGIDEGDGRTAVRAPGVPDQIDRAAALRAGNLAHRAAQLGELRQRRTADEILFTQKLIEGEELPVIVGATPKSKPGGAL